MNAIRNDIFFQIGIEMLTLHYLNVSKVRTQIIPTSIKEKQLKTTNTKTVKFSYWVFSGIKYNRKLNILQFSF